MNYVPYRIANRHSLSFKVRRTIRKTRTRVLTELVRMLEGQNVQTTVNA